MDTNNLLNEIAAYRSKMNGFSKGKNLTNPEAIKLRQGLDNLLRKYYSVLNKREVLSH